MTPGSVHTTLPSSNSKFQDKTVSNFPDDGQGPADIHGLADGTLMNPGHNGGQVPAGIHGLADGTPVDPGHDGRQVPAGIHGLADGTLMDPVFAGSSQNKGFS